MLGGGSWSGGDKWQKEVSEAYFPLDIECHDRTRFSGQMQRWSLGIVGLSRIRCDGLIYRRHSRHFLNENDSSLLIAIPEDTEIQFNQNQRRTTCKPGGFLVERSDAPYEYWHGRPNRQWVLKVPSASVRARAPPPVSRRSSGQILPCLHIIGSFASGRVRALGTDLLKY